MTVQVKNASTNALDKFDKATEIAVNDGHLHVGADGYNGMLVHAIYAPGQWRHAEVKNVEAS